MSHSVTGEQLDRVLSKNLDGLTVKLFKYFDEQFKAQHLDSEVLRGEFHSSAFHALSSLA